MIPTQKTTPSTTASPARRLSTTSTVALSGPGETGLRKRKMKRVRISGGGRGRADPPTGGRGRVVTELPSGGPGRAGAVNQHLQVRQLLIDSNEAGAGPGEDVLARARSRAILNRARLRSRMSSSSSVVSSSTEQSISIDELELPHSFRRPSRTISNLTAWDLQVLEPAAARDRERVAGPHSPPGRTAAMRRKLPVAARRVDEVVKAPPHMKGGLVIIRSYCRYRNTAVTLQLPDLDLHCGGTARPPPLSF